jgi:hypothetical protein
MVYRPRRWTTGTSKLVLCAALIFPEGIGVSRRHNTPDNTVYLQAIVAGTGWIIGTQAQNG